MRFFNTEGPVRPADHYCLPPLQRWDLDGVLALIDQQTYFVAQLDGDLAGLGLAAGWLVIFDRRAGQPPIAERTACGAALSPQGRRILVVRG